MKKSTGFLIVLFLIYSCKSEQPHPQSDLKMANLKGKVWKIERIIQDADIKCTCALKTDNNESIYIYDSKGNLLISYTVDGNGNVNDSSKYAYDKHGVCSEITKFMRGKPTGKEVPVFKSGKLTEVKTYNKNGDMVSRLVYKYSGTEKSEEKALNSSGEVISLVQHEFVNGQLVTETEKDNQGEVISISRFTRNASNDMTQCLYTVTQDHKEYKLTYQYEYDATGNWIKRTEFFDGHIVNTVVRNIKYYKM